MAWLGTYKYRFKMLIPSGTATAALTDRDVTVQIALKSGINDMDTSFIFEVIQSEYLKMAITDADGTTQLYVEVEKWDYDTANGLIHFKKPSVTTGDNYYYIYFDDTQTDNSGYVGPAQSTPAQAVWDSTYDYVLNFADISASLVKLSNGTSTLPANGSMTNADIVDGKIGNAIKFDGVDDQIDLAGTHEGAVGTIEMLVKIDPTSGGGGLLISKTTSETGAPCYDVFVVRNRIGFEENSYNYGAEVQFPNGADGTGCVIYIPTECVSVIPGPKQLYETWEYIAVTAGAAGTFFLNSDKYSFSLFQFYPDEKVFPHTVAYRQPWNGLCGTTGYTIPALTCQTLRCSKINRSDAWINFSYLNMTDQTTTVESVEFYENTVNSIPFDLYGNPVLETVYHLVLSATGFDDIVIPVETFQMSHGKDKEAYMSVVISDISYLDDITDRYDGLMQLYMLIGDRDDYDRDNLIMQTRIGYPKTSIGSENESITLDGYGVFGSRYLSLDLSYNSYNTYDTDTGKRRFRFPSIPYYMRVNDTITVDGVEVLVNSISYNSGGALEVASIG